jgi:putative transposase
VINHKRTRHSYKGSDVVNTLERIAADYGRPRRVRVDNGSEFINLCAYKLDVIIDFSRPCNPADNAYVESYNGRVRAEPARKLVLESGRCAG